MNLQVTLRRNWRIVQNFWTILKFLILRKRKLLIKLIVASGLSFGLLIFIAKLLKRKLLRRSKSSTSRQQQSLRLLNELTSSSNNSSVKQQQQRKKNPGLNKQFILELKYLLKIMFPRLISKQTGLLIFHTLTLVCRTFLSIYVAKLEGSLVKNIVQKSPRTFAKNLFYWLLIALPATTCNSLIRYLESNLDLELKSRLVNNSLESYFKDRVYYRIALNQNADPNVQIDQNLSEDTEKLTQLLVRLYSQLTKPLLDISLITFTLISLAKKQNFNYGLPTFIGFFVMAATALLMRAISPRFGQLAAEEAKRKGYLRFLYARIQTNSEEIAFYSGEKIEVSLIKRSYLFLKQQLELIYVKKLWFIIVEQFFMKYIWSASGLVMISMPVLFSNKQTIAIELTKTDPNDPLPVSEADQELLHRTEQFTIAKNLLISTADAFERIMTSYKEVIELTGLVRRVYEMYQLFDSITSNNNDSTSTLTDKNNNKILADRGRVFESSEQDSIIIDSISVITPNGDVIVPSLSLRIEKGMNLLITGPNGCGKSSLFRIISGLWPLQAGSNGGGTIHRPKLNEMFYIPQKPYLPIGTLRDQIIYPDSIEDMRRKSISDEQLLQILDIVNLQYVVTREGGFNAVADWKDVLSGGEKQRIGLSRLFYHKPKFAFLDECTSAVSIDVEGKIYLTAKNEYKITLLTIAHRATLWQYHDYILQFDGHGHWKFEELNKNLDERLNLKQEKDSLEKSLLNISSTTARLKELCEILGEDSIVLSTNQIN